MTCDNCSKACAQASNGPGVPPGHWYCDDCARGAGVRVPAVALSDALEIARRAKVEADAADKAARREARAERARALLAEIRRRREAKLAKPEVEPAPAVEPVEAPDAIRADLSLAPEPARFALVAERPTRPGPASVRATPTFAPCRAGDHANCTGAYFDDAGAPVRCPCSCHVQGALFAKPKTQGMLF